MPTIRRHAPAAEPHVSTPPPEDPAAAGQDAPGPLQVPAETTPTWELEMLVSGAVLFALFQLPPVLSGAFSRALPQLGDTSFIVVFEIYITAKAMLYALMVGFVLHLASRAYWVALVGLDSVFPHGIRWERGTFGPLSREVYRKRFASLPVLIERIDNFASVIFAAAFGIVFMLLGGLLIVGVLAGISWLVSTGLLHGRGFDRVFLSLVFSTFALPMAASIIDRRFGSRMPPDGMPARIIRVAALVVYRGLGLAIHGPVTQTLFTNVRKKIVVPVMVLTMLAAMGTSMLELLLSRRAISLDGYGLLPRSGSTVLDNRHYADQRIGNDAYSTVPFIQSDVVRDPYIRIFLPYRPRSDEAALARTCAPVAAVARASGASDARRAQAGVDMLACLVRLHPISLDGRVVDPGFRFYTDPQSGIKGLLGYLPVDSLAKGPHVLAIQPAPLPPSAPREDSLNVRSDSILFRL